MFIIINFNYAETDVGQASHVATMEINEDTPSYDVMCKSTQLEEDTEVPLQRLTRPPSHQEATHLTLPVGNQQAFHQYRIDDSEDLELIIEYLRKDCEKVMQKGICRVNVGIYLEK